MRIVIYHRGCPDGMTAAWSLWKKFGDQDTRYISAAWGDPVVFPESVEGADVIFADFSWSRDAIRGLAQVARSVTVLDHHRTTAEDLLGLSESVALNPKAATYVLSNGNIVVVMDMNRSGAGIAWDWAHPGKDRPRIVEYAQDRDLWRFKLAYSREIAQWLRSFSYAMWDWDHAAIILQDDAGYAAACKVGGALLKFERQQVHMMVEHANWRWIPGAGFPVPVANASAFFSEVAEKLLEDFPTAKFSAYYWDRRNNIRQWGLRSRSAQEFDVSEVAKRFGGGGHATAAGWTEPASLPLPKLADGGHE